jgi:hypothetical protein
MNIIEGIQKECNRVRDLIKFYESFPTGIFAADLMKQSIKDAEAAIASCDTIKMIACYKELSEFEE